ncbi:MAG TPA: M13-type metalloendopeptidase [Usitatibacter sp.]|nr:M13-type metalloendopeptidase [Usitatibacter sp.]
MSLRIPAFLSACLLAAACAAPAPRLPGVDPANFDTAVRPQDDLYRYVNGGWLERTAIPPDKGYYGVFIELRDRTLEQVHGIVDALATDPAAARDPDARKIRDLYASFMDEKRIDARGLAPVAGELARIDRISSKGEIPALVAHLNEIGVSAPYGADVEQDAKDSTRYVVDLRQAGLGLPDRDYYLKEDDPRLAEVRSKYRAHVEKMLRMAGASDAAAEAGEVLAIETGLARAHWTRVENRDPVKTYNPVDVGKLDGLAPGFDWKAYLVAADMDGRVRRVIVSQPSYMTDFAKLLADTPLPAWKDYFRWRLLDAYSPYLSRPFVDEHFAFDGTVVQGIPQNRPRWQRGLSVVEEAMGQGLGKLYVARYFTPEKKARMDALVANLVAAYRESIEGLTWMGPETKKAALAKLAALAPHIGYPAKWRDYSKLEIEPGDLVGNVMRGQRFDYERNIAKLGKPVDREEWLLSPQTVNAYYYPPMNEVVFPAAILQPPFFDASADDALNYGAIGAVIGHEISHGFDDHGSQYDAQGNLRDWWTKEDRREFRERTAALVAQYDAYSPLPGYHLNGKLTLGENIADNSGLAIAWKAYRIALGGRPAPVIDGFTGAQRFYIGWARVWAEKRRPEEAIRLLKIDPHSPGRFRADGPPSNEEPFYAAFGVKEGDGMYRPPGERVTIW